MMYYHKLLDSEHHVRTDDGRRIIILSTPTMIPRTHTVQKGEATALRWIQYDSSSFSQWTGTDRIPH